MFHLINSFHPTDLTVVTLKENYYWVGIQVLFSKYWITAEAVKNLDSLTAKHDPQANIWVQEGCEW